MRVELLRKLTDVSSYIFEEMTDKMSEIDMAREFWKYLRSKFLDDMNQKVKVSDFVREFIKTLSEEDFNLKYKIKLGNIKKSRQQLDFCCSCVTTMLHYSSYGSKIIDWS
jgi:sulfur relay (sulfurtransferase) DsrC/TusE family protein